MARRQPLAPTASIAISQCGRSASAHSRIAAAMDSISCSRMLGILLLPRPGRAVACGADSHRNPIILRICIHRPVALYWPNKHHKSALAAVCAPERWIAVLFTAFWTFPIAHLPQIIHCFPHSTRSSNVRLYWAHQYSTSRAERWWIRTIIRTKNSNSSGSPSHRIALGDGEDAHRTALPYEACARLDFGPIHHSPLHSHSRTRSRHIRSLDLCPP